jgi:Zinc finger protein
MGGASFSGIAMNVIDFNQVICDKSAYVQLTSSFPEMRAWSRKKEDLHQLVESLFINDPYYPRPRPEDPLYQKFCVGYTDAYPKNSDDAVQLAQDFLCTIEAEHCRRDSTVRD